MVTSPEVLCIVGLGRVGLTLAVTFANVGFRVIGVERDKSIVAALRAGQPHFFEEGLEALLKQQVDKNLTIVEEIPEEGCDGYIICVATPVDRQTKEVALEPLRRASEEVAERVTDGALVVVRSTVPVGVTRGLVLPTLEKSGRDFKLAFCPERTIEGRALAELREHPQIVSGIDEASQEMGVKLFDHVTSTIVRVPSFEAAEMIKLIDNTHRDLNFAFANEVALIAERFGLVGTDLAHWANLGYARNNIPVPGLVGGTCLTKDPYILAHSAASVGYETRLPLQSRAINESLPFHLYEGLKQRLSQAGKELSQCKIMVAGIAFKGRPDTDDLRDSPAIDLTRHLLEEARCPTVYAHDFVVTADQMRQENLEPCGLEEGFKDADAVVFMNNHPGYYSLDIQSLVASMRQPAVIIDGWHVFNPSHMRELDGLLYGGLGVG